MSGWTSDELDRIADAQKLEIAPRLGGTPASSKTSPTPSIAQRR